LRKTFGKSDEPVFTLTPDTEKAIAWLEDLQRREEFVGTESRFLQIFLLLKEIRDRSTTDVTARIAQLEQERDLVQQKIDRIRETGEVDPYNSTQLQERFRLANDATRQLIADFREIEQNFRRLTRKVQEAQLQPDARKGSVVGGVLDADRELKESDQGRSFYSFWNFLGSPSKQEELNDLIQSVYNLEELQPLTEQYTLLRRIKRSLLDAGNYIIESNNRLAEKLRQMLDEGNLKETRRVAELINDVQRLALQVANYASAEPDFWELEGEPAISLAMARPLYTLAKSETPTFSLDFSGLPKVIGDEQIAELAQQFYLDEAELARRVNLTLEKHSTISLSELIQLYPVTQGLSEIVAYVAIATESERHFINTSIIESIIIPSLELEKQLRLSLPQVIFCR
jgi:hypothetical protein